MGAVQPSTWWGAILPSACWGQYHLQPVGGGGRWGSTTFSLWGAVPPSAWWGSTIFSLLRAVPPSAWWGAVPSSACGGECSLQPGEAEDPEFIAVCSEGQAFLLFHLEFPVPGTVSARLVLRYQ